MNSPVLRPALAVHRRRMQAIQYRPATRCSPLDAYTQGCTCKPASCRRWSTEANCLLCLYSLLLPAAAALARRAARPIFMPCLPRLPFAVRCSPRYSVQLGRNVTQGLARGFPLGTHRCRVCRMIWAYRPSGLQGELHSFVRYGVVSSSSRPRCLQPARVTVNSRHQYHRSALPALARRRPCSGSAHAAVSC